MLKRFERRDVILLNFTFDDIICALIAPDGGGAKNLFCRYFLSLFVGAALVDAV